MPINRLTRGTQIPIAPAETLYVPLSAVSFLGGFRTPAAEHAAPSLKRPASETLPNSGIASRTRSRNAGDLLRTSNHQDWPIRGPRRAMISAQRLPGSLTPLVVGLAAQGRRAS